MICPTKQNFALKDGETAIPQVFLLKVTIFTKKNYYSHVSDAIYYILSMSKKFRWIAICAPQNKNYRRRKKTGELEIIPCQVGSGDFYTKNVGPFNVRVQKLEALGYTVIPLTYDLLDKCVDQRKIREIRTLINKYCVA